jgi:hypothetical protein
MPDRPFSAVDNLIRRAQRVEHIPKERQAETAAKLMELLDQQLEACGISDGDA